MHLGIVCGSVGWHVLDLQRAGFDLSIQTSVIDLCSISSSDDLLCYDALLIRTFPSGSLEQTIFRLALLYRTERAGQLIVNSPAAFEACVDKFTTTTRLQAAGIPTPATVCCQTLDAAMAAYDQLGGDVVIKPIFGSEGKGLIKVSDRDAAWRACSMLCQLGAVVYLQEFVKHAGYDMRAFVLGGKVLAAMKRSHANDWRTNIARGATAEAVTLTAEQEALALRAAACVGAEMAGVDMVEGMVSKHPLPLSPSPSGEEGNQKVIEVNGVPGWKGLASVTDMDIAQKVLVYMVERAPKT
ncbi:MAG TPA: RimK family alpha-L-glutamate ligase [Gemmatales bacterium]|nr:RimK family alpha-L-glutamate ligase [Gemmatales bacterium]